MKIINWIIALSLILINTYFIPLSHDLLTTNYGYAGLAIVLLITLSVNLFIIPALLTFIKRFHKSLPLFILNSIGLIWALVWVYLLNN